MYQTRLSPPVLVGYSASPFGSTVVTHGLTSFAMSGHYAFTLSNNQNYFLVYDMSGAEFPSASIGELRAGNLHVTANMDVYNQLNVQGGLSVGSGGIFSAGPLASYGTSTLNALSVGGTIGQHALDVYGDCIAFRGACINSNGPATTVTYPAASYFFSSNTTQAINTTRFLGAAGTAPATTDTRWLHRADHRYAQRTLRNH